MHADAPKPPSRSEIRNAEARAELEPLAEGERPGAVTAAALVTAVLLVMNIAAAIFFLFSGQVVWPLAAVMAVGALAGGALGGRLAGRIQPATLRKVVVGIGAVVAVIYLVR